MVAAFLLLIVIFVIGLSLRTLFLPAALQEKSLSWESFVYLLFVFTTVYMGFGIIYFIFLANGFNIFLENGESVRYEPLDSLQTSFYFSGITLFSIGYGDIAPIGIGRAIAVIEGIVGYTIPASFVVRTVIDFRRENG